MATFTYTYPAFNGEPDVANYAANLNYMLSTNARAFALNSMVHADGTNHPSRSGANLNEFYATASKVSGGTGYNANGAWTMVSNPSGNPSVYSFDSTFINVTGTGLWLIGGIVQSSTAQGLSVFWYLNGNTQQRRANGFDVGLGAYSTAVFVIPAPFIYSMNAYTSAAGTLTYRAYGLQVAN